MYTLFYFWLIFQGSIIISKWIHCHLLVFLSWWIRGRQVLRQYPKLKKKKHINLQNQNERMQSRAKYIARGARQLQCLVISKRGEPLLNMNPSSKEERFKSWLITTPESSRTIICTYVHSLKTMRLETIFNWFPWPVSRLQNWPYANNAKRY